jgi:small conductance mechanosensitive channel
MPDLTQLASELTEKLHSWLQELVVMLPNLVLAVLAVLAGALLARLTRNVVHRALMGVTSNAPISQLLANLARIAIVALSCFIALGLLELEKTVTSLLAGVGVVGLALGFAFQDIAANFMSGFLMVINQPFDVGDLVEVAGQRGRIRGISLRASELETLQGLTVLLPNKDVFQNAIINYTRTPHRRLDLAVGTAYGDDLEKVRRVTIEAVRNVPHRDRSRDVRLFFEAFGDSSINFTLHIWLERSDELAYLEARSEAMIATKKAFDEAGITIPFPIRTLDFGARAVGGEALSDMPLRLAKVERIP